VFVLEPGAEAANPVTFRIEAPPEAVRVTYTADFQWQIGESVNPDDDWAITSTFTLLGDHTIEILAFGADDLPVGRVVHDIAVLPDPARPNRFGVVLGDVQAQGWDHATLATELGALGVDRVYLHVADGVPDCAVVPLLCDESVPAAYRAAGIEPWGWANAAPGDERAQADLIFELVPRGYWGVVLRVGEPFRGQAQALDDLLLGWLLARNECAGGAQHEGGEFPILAWLPPSPDAGGLVTEDLEEKADGFVPLAPDGVDASYCAWRTGTSKPIHPMVPFDSPDPLGPQLVAAGREALLYGIPDADDDAGWQRLGAIDWAANEFSEPVCN